MNPLHFPRTATIGTAILALALGLARPAAAAPAYLELGGFVPSDTPASGAIAISDRIPFIPISGAVTQISGFIPLLDGRYALTGEIRTPDQHGAYFGVGAGLGRLNVATGPVVDAIAAFPTGIPNVSVALRFYASTSRGVGTAGFAGLRVRLLSASCELGLSLKGLSGLTAPAVCNNDGVAPCDAHGRNVKRSSDAPSATQPHDHVKLKCMPPDEV
jgi:hypothetical protein